MYRPNRGDKYRGPKFAQHSQRQAVAQQHICEVNQKIDNVIARRSIGISERGVIEKIRPALSAGDTNLFSGGIHQAEWLKIKRGNIFRRDRVNARILQNEGIVIEWKSGTKRVGVRRRG